MRDLIAVVVLSIAFATGATQAGPLQPPPADVGTGRVAWFDLTTTDLARSKEFYAKLFGWTYTALQGTDLAVTIVSAGKEIGTMRASEGAISGFNGVVYLQVPDIVAATQKAKELGAIIVPGFPFNLTHMEGAISLCTDPAGHPVGMYSRKPIPKP